MKGKERARSARVCVLASCRDDTAAVEGVICSNASLRLFPNILMPTDFDDEHHGMNFPCGLMRGSPGARASDIRNTETAPCYQSKHRSREWPAAKRSAAMSTKSSDSVAQSAVKGRIMLTLEIISTVPSILLQSNHQRHMIS